MQIIKDIFNLPQGAVWLKADLHVHTPASQDTSEKWNPYEDGEAKTFRNDLIETSDHFPVTLDLNL